MKSHHGDGKKKRKKATSDKDDDDAVMSPTAVGEASPSGSEGQNNRGGKRRARRETNRSPIYAYDNGDDFEDYGGGGSATGPLQDHGGKTYASKQLPPPPTQFCQPVQQPPLPSLPYRQQYQHASQPFYSGQQQYPYGTSSLEPKEGYEAVLRNMVRDLDCVVGDYPTGAVGDIVSRLRGIADAGRMALAGSSTQQYEAEKLMSLQGGKQMDPPGSVFSALPSTTMATSTQAPASRYSQQGREKDQRNTNNLLDSQLMSSWAMEETLAWSFVEDSTDPLLEIPSSSLQQFNFTPLEVSLTGDGNNGAGDNVASIEGGGEDRVSSKRRKMMKGFDHIIEQGEGTGQGEGQEQVQGRGQGQEQEQEQDIKMEVEQEQAVPQPLNVDILAQINAYHNERKMEQLEMFRQIQSGKGLASVN